MVIIKQLIPWIVNLNNTDIDKNFFFCGSLNPEVIKELSKRPMFCELK